MLSEKDQLPWHPLSSPPFFSALLQYIPHIPSYSVPFSVYWLRQTTLHVEHVIHGWLDALLCLGRNHIKCWFIWNKILCLYSVRKRMIPSLTLWLKRSYRCVLYWQRWPQPLLSTFPLPQLLFSPLVCPFPFVLIHSFPSHLSCGKDLQAK